MAENAVRVFIDDLSTPVAEVTNPGNLPSTGLIFTIWVDNYVMTGDLVDYAKIYVPDPESLPALSTGGLAAVALLLLAAVITLGPLRTGGWRG